MPFFFNASMTHKSSILKGDEAKKRDAGLVPKDANFQFYAFFPFKTCVLHTRFQVVTTPIFVPKTSIEKSRLLGDINEL